MHKIRHVKIIADNEQSDRYYFYCPGCECDHWFQTSGSPRWTLTGTMDTPTVKPSIRVFCPAHDDQPEKTLCHFFIDHGVIQYLSDSVHRYAGQNVEMKDIYD